MSATNANGITDVLWLTGQRGSIPSETIRGIIEQLEEQLNNRNGEGKQMIPEETSLIRISLHHILQRRRRV